MGDADVRTEHEILKQFDVHADVLKVGITAHILQQVKRL